MLTGAGQQLAARLGQPHLAPVPAPLLVISAFNGIGGSFRGYDLAGIRPEALISIECDRSAEE